MAELVSELTSRWTSTAMATRVVRYADLKPCYNAFIDTRSPGSEAKENFTIIGPGVSENPDQYVHIAEPHGFNIGGARQPPGCINSQHSHDTAEIFVVHSGEWQINIGEHGDDAHLLISPGDVVSVPTQMFRGFTNIGDASGFLWVVLGGDDPGRVLWAPYVFDMARDHGLMLLNDGSLVDLRAGQQLPHGAEPMPRTTIEQVAALAVPDGATLEAIVWRAGRRLPQSGITAIIGADAPLAADQDIRMARIDLGSNAPIHMAAADAPRVLFVHEGEVDMVWDDGRQTLGQGDTITVPMGLAHAMITESGAVLYHVGA